MTCPFHKNNNKLKWNFNFKTKPLSDIVFGQKIWYKINPDNNKFGKLMKYTMLIRSWEDMKYLEGNNSQSYIRNRLLIKPYIEQ